jgi:hypothetical protein
MVFAIVIIFYDANSKRTPGNQPSGDMLLTAEQYDRMQYRIEDMEAMLVKNDLPIPGSRLPNGRPGRPERPERPQRPSK